LEPILVKRSKSITFKFFYQKNFGENDVISALAVWRQNNKKKSWNHFAMFSTTRGQLRFGSVAAVLVDSPQ